ncbi:MAG: STAS domain-containing protein [Eubacteriales bacterium]
MSLQIKSGFDEESNNWKVELLGELDAMHETEFKETLNNIYAEKSKDIMLNFQELYYIDSTGLGIIIGAYKKLKENGNILKIQNPKKNILKLLSITSLDKILL